MLLLICKLVLLIYGIIILATGKMKVSKNKVATGAAARIAGVMYMLPLPLGFAVGLVMGATGVINAANLEEMLVTIAIIQVVIVLGCVAVGMIIGFLNAKPLAIPMNQVYQAPPPMQ